jgi:hypothetical protein
VQPRKERLFAVTIRGKYRDNHTGFVRWDENDRARYDPNDHYKYDNNQKDTAGVSVDSDVAHVFHSSLLGFSLQV